MNTFTLKILACIFMLIDHTGSLLFPRVHILRGIGRLSFPIFAFLITEGYLKTKNIKRYALRLFLFGVISQIPYSLAWNTMSLNIFFTLLMGLLGLRVIDTQFDLKYFNNKFKFINKNYKVLEMVIKIIIIILICMVAEFIHVDYGAYGVLTILVFKLFKGDWKKLILCMALLNIYDSVQTARLYNLYLMKITPYTFIQVLSMLSLVFIYNYNEDKGKSLKYLFYVFYPIHIMILYIIKIFI